MLSDQAPKEGISGTPPYFWMASRLRPQRARTAHCLVGGPADLGAFLEACHCVLEGDSADPAAVHAPVDRPLALGLRVAIHRVLETKPRAVKG